MCKIEEFDESQPGVEICDEAYDAFYNCNYTEAERLLEIVLSDYNLLPEWRLRLDIGYSQLETGKLSEAIGNLEFAYKEIDRSEMSCLFVEVSTQLARIYHILLKHRKALKYLKGADKYVQLITAPEWMFAKYDYYRYLGDSFSFLNRLTESVGSYNQAAHILRNELADHKYFLCKVLLRQAVVYLRMNRMDKAKVTLKSIHDSEIEIYDSYEYHRVMIMYFDLLGKPHPQDIIRQYEFMLELGIKDKDKARMHNTAARAYYDLGDRKKARELIFESAKYSADAKWLRESTQAFILHLGAK